MNLSPIHWVRQIASKIALPTQANSQGFMPFPSADRLAYARPRTEHELVGLYRDTAYYCANINARGVARTPLCMYQKRGSGQSPTKYSKRCTKLTRARLKSIGAVSDDDELEEIQVHPFLDLLDKPFQQDGVGMMGRFDLLELTQLYLEDVGRSYWLIDEGPGGEPLQLFPLIANHVQPYKAASSDRFVDEYRYQTGRTLATFTPTQVVPFLCRDLRNPYTGGYSPMQAASDRIGVNLSYMAQTQALLDNRARPDSVISPKSNESLIARGTRKRMEAWFMGKFRRAGLGSPLICDEPIDVKPLTFSPKDMGELNDDDKTVAQIARIFDVPLSMINKDANRASAGEGREQHAHDALTPRLRRIEQVINSNVMPRYDATGRLFVAFDEPYHKPIAPEAKDLPVLVPNILMADEAREMMNYGPLPEKYLAELEQRRQDELAAAQPPMKPGGKEPASANQSKSVLAIRQRIRAGKVISLNGCKH